MRNLLIGGAAGYAYWYYNSGELGWLYQNTGAVGGFDQFMSQSESVVVAVLGGALIGHLVLP